MQLAVEIYIYLYLSGNAQANFQTQGTSEKFHKKSTGDKIQATRFS